ncbi:MAG TPA: dihydropyrimidinase [Myxococcales bacterium]|jgi:dihydropyrimidinase
MRTLIQGGTVATGSDLFVADVLLEGESVAAVGVDLSKLGPFDRTVDARGKYVLPGGVDPHVHLQLTMGNGMVSSDDFETGTRAAAFGGTTTVIDFAAQPKGGSLAAGLEQRHQEAQGKAVVDYGFHLTVRSATKEALAELDSMIAREGVSSFKLFTAYPGFYQLDDGSLLRVLQRTRENGGLVCVHAENGPAIEVLVEQALARGETAPRFHALTRPARLEGEATSRCIALAEVAGAPLYVVHLTARESLEPVREARLRGQTVWAETCPQYLLLSQRDIEAPGQEGAKVVFSPPVRAPGNEEHLWRGLALGDLATVGTDHCPFLFKGQKDQAARFTEIPNGLPGIETRLLILWEEGVRKGRFDVNRFVQLVSTEPAKIFGLYPKKGALVPGADADVVVWDPERRQSLSAAALHMRTDYSPYEGRTVKGAPAMVFGRGELIVDDGRWLGRPGRGRFLKRGTRPAVKGAAS